MHTLEIKLIQHTPIIHFQHNQYGATLRASEVKPKLDKYILKKLTDEEKNNGIRRGWLKDNNGRKWLDYKMFILATGQNTDEYLFTSDISEEKENNLISINIKVINNSPFFAQREDDKNITTIEQWNSISKKGLNQSQLIVRLIVRSDELAEMLKEHIRPFFVINNFGNRQDKGFGSYLPQTIIDNNECQEVNLPESEIENILKGEYDFVYRKRLSIDINSNKYITVFHAIKDDYQKLKSGKSNTNSELSKFFRDSDRDGTMRMEDQYFKAKIEQLLLGNPTYSRYSIEKNVTNNTGSDSNLKYIYARALLGLAEQYEYSLYQRNITHNNRRTKAEDATIIVKVLKINGIERFQSPLCFKVINNNIYIVGNNESKISGEKIQFEFFLNTNNNNISIGKGELEIPSYFNIGAFMDFAHTNNPDQYTCIKNNFRKHK